MLDPERRAKALSTIAKWKAQAIPPTMDEFTLRNSVSMHVFYNSLPDTVKDDMERLASVYDPGGKDFWCCPLHALRLIEACGWRIAKDGNEAA